MSQEYFELLGKYTIVQDKDYYMFTSDSVHLARFVRLRGGERICDLGAGCGIVSFLLAEREKNNTFTLCEVQPELYALLAKNIELNRTGDRMKAHLRDMRTLGEITEAGSYDVVVCNPPYFKRGSCAQNESPSRAAARHEILVTIEEILAVAKRLLRFGGALYLTFPAERLCELVAKLKGVNLEPKQLAAVAAKPAAAPHLFLVKAVLGGREGCAFLPQIVENS